jgi:hypothetical protein
MSNFISFSPKDIEKLGLTCPKCGSEVVIDVPTDITKQLARFPERCPACGPMVQKQAPFAYSNGPDWLDHVGKMRRNDDATFVRFYFKEQKK